MSSSAALGLLLAAVFAWAGFLNLSGPAFVRADFAKWGYPSALRIAVGFAEIVAAAMLLNQTTRVLGAGLAIAVLTGVMISFVRTNEWLRLEYPVVLLVIAVITAAL